MTENPEAETKPFINERGDLVIPFDAPERYHKLSRVATSVACLYPIRGGGRV